jgi:hypothetical protein
MVMSWWGHFVQFHPSAEGDCLWQLGLLDVRETRDGCEVLPTEKLRSLFNGSFDMESVYPLLVEVVVYHTYRYEPRLVDMWRVGQKLQSLGMMRDGLEWLNARFLDRRPA